MTDCNSACTVSGTRENIGGLVGSNSNMIATSYSTGAVNGNSRVGGLAGSNGGNITSSYSTGSVSGVDYTGSLVGYNYSGRILTSYSTGSVNGNKYVGGLVGYNRSSVTQCYSIGSAIGISCVGGLVGFNYESTITTSYSTGSVSGNEYVGGLVGFNRGSVTQCYSTGFVSGTDNIGGLVGSNTDQYGNEGVVSDCFWDTETSGQATSDASIGKTTAEMQMASTFLDAGWDFVGQSDGPHDIWAEPEGGGYPILAWQLPPGFGLPTFSGGTGEPDDPYLISTAQELNSIGHNARLMNCHFTLVQSLDLMGVQFYPIGDLAFPYTGMFNGNGQTLSHLTITGESNLGLFAALGAGAIVRDLGVLDVNITGSGSSIGGLVGWNGDYWSTGEGGLVLNCYSSGSVSGSSSVGGLVGYNDPDSNITMSYSIGSVSGTSSVGGLVGYNFGKIATSYSTGEISGTRNVGGLVGYNASGSMIQCFSTASASGTSRIGGLVGDNWTGTLMQCYSAGAVDGNDYVGGLVGATKSIWDADTKALESFWDIETSGQVTSADGIGKTTAEMQTARTFLDAGWDFIGEVDNGTDDLWWILEGQDYPKLWRENDNN